MPTLSFDMMAKLSTQNIGNRIVDANSSNDAETTRTSENDVLSIDAYPKLHNVHIRHRIPHSSSKLTTTASTETTSTSTTVVPTTSQPGVNATKLSSSLTSGKISWSVWPCVFFQLL
jgi:hypothetical protein